MNARDNYQILESEVWLFIKAFGPTLAECGLDYLQLIFHGDRHVVNPLKTVTTITAIPKRASAVDWLKLDNLLTASLAKSAPRVPAIKRIEIITVPNKHLMIRATVDESKS